MRYVTLLVAALVVACSATDDQTDLPPAPNPPRFIVGPVLANVTVGDSLQMSATFENVDPVPITWPSSDRTVATVSVTGTVHGFKAGKATVTARAPAYGFVTPIEVTVR